MGKYIIEAGITLSSCSRENAALRAATGGDEG